MFLVLLFVCGVILYGSFYPWDFHWRQLDANPLWILLRSWPAELDRSTVKDVGLNLLLYFPLGIAGALHFGGSRRYWVRLSAPLVIGLGLSCTVELVQLFLPSRTCSGLDVVCNVCGTAMGLAVGGFLRTRPLPEVIRRHSDGVLLCISWCVWQLFPAFPVWHQQQLEEKVHQLSQFTWAPSELGRTVAGWLALACVLDTLRPRLSQLVLPALLLTIPLKLLIASRMPSWMELIGAVLVMLVWELATLSRRLQLRYSAVAVAALIVLRELYPFHFGPVTAPFEWIPFAATLAPDSLTSYVIVLEKAFLYASTIWLFWRNGISLRVSTAGLATALLILERLQMYLPDRVAETTDALLALLCGIAFGFLSQQVATLAAKRSAGQSVTPQSSQSESYVLLRRGAAG